MYSISELPTQPDRAKADTAARSLQRWIMGSLPDGRHRPPPSLREVHGFEILRNGHKTVPGQYTSGRDEGERHARTAARTRVHHQRRRHRKGLAALARRP